MPALIRTIGAAAALALMAGCGAGRQAAPEAAGPAIALGDNLSGEACRAVRRAPVRGERVGRATYDVLCAAWQRPSGSIVTTPATGGAARAAVERAMKDDPAAQAGALRMDCPAPKWVSDGGQDYALASCAMKSGQWPYVTIGGAHDGVLYLAEGIPAVANVLLASVRDGVVERSGAPADRAAQVRVLEAALGPGAGAAASGGAVAQFEELVEQARLQDSIENYTGAELAYQGALQIQIAALGPEHPGVGDTLANLAMAISNQGRGDEAELLFQRAEPIIRRSTDPTVLPRFQSYLALHAANQRQFARALGLMRQVTAQRREMASQFGGDDDAPDPSGLSARAILGDVVLSRAELAQGLIFEAAMALRLDDVSSAEAAATEARRIVDGTRGLPPWWRPRVLALTGEVNARRGRAQQAERDFSEAATLRRSIFGASFTTATGYFDLGQFRSGDGRFGPALDAYRVAFGMIDADAGARPEIRFERLAPFMEAALGQAVENPAQRPALFDEMFRVSQLVREGAAGQTIARASARVANGDPRITQLTRDAQETGRERDRLRLELAGETAKPRDQRDSRIESDLRTRATAAERRTVALEQELQAAFPGYANLTSPKPVEAKALAELLRPDEAFVTFVFGAEAGFAFVIRKDGVTAARIEIGEEELNDAVAELRRAFVTTGGRLQPFDLRASYNLYRKLLAPLEQRLQGVSRLVMATNGALLSLPPGLLVTAPPTAPDNYAQAAWLAQRMAVTLTPSVRAFVELKEMERRPSAPRPFIGYGAPTFVGAAPRSGAATAPDPMQALARECRTGGPLPPSLLRALAPLPETADELRRVAALLGAGPGDVRLGREATETDVRTRALDQYRVIYFATHGLLPGELRCQGEPGLALSPPDTAPAGVDDDGLLDASAIASLHLAADLVVLSACNTGGAGGKFGGEALSGLAEAFFYAGARSLVVSHWEVPSQPTVALMTGMFDLLARQGGAPAEALRRAQLALIAAPATAHPFYWAAFTVVGGGGDLTPAQRAAYDGTDTGTFQ